MTRRWTVAVVALLVAGSATGAATCGEQLGSSLRRVESTRYAIAYRIEPAPIVVGRHFVLELAVCAKDGAPPPQSLRVDAQMPAHRHGMNYRPGVTTVAPGRFRADGLLFHMPGQWEFVFDVGANGKTERLSSPIEIE